MPTADLLDKRNAKIQGMFARIAPWYDFLNHLLSLNVDKWWRRTATRLVPPGPPADGPVLDLCTGTGDLAFAYDRAAKGAVPVVGADFCHEMLVRARKKNAAGRVRFVEADAQQLPFADDQFQIVTVSFGLRNVADTLRGLREMTRVCRPGGRVAVLEFSRPRGRFFGPLYRWYFRAVLPRVGQLISKSPDSAYVYLPASVLEFPDYEDLCALMERAGLERTEYTPLTFGIATLYVGRKPAPSPAPSA